MNYYDYITAGAWNTLSLIERQNFVSYLLFTGMIKEHNAYHLGICDKAIPRTVVVLSPHGRLSLQMPGNSLKNRIALTEVRRMSRLGCMYEN